MTERHEEKHKGKEYKQLTNYIKSKLCNAEQSITIGQIEDGRFIIHAGNTETPSPYDTLIVSEKDFYSIIATLIAYGEHYGINLSEKIKEYAKSDNIEYIYPDEDDS